MTFSVTQYIHNVNPGIFPEPHKFIPDRYLGPNEAETLRYLAPYGRGPGMCFGLNLAWPEMYLTITAVIGSLDLQLYDTCSSMTPLTGT
jgi:cytochrome P450